MSTASTACYAYRQISPPQKSRVARSSSVASLLFPRFAHFLDGSSVPCRINQCWFFQHERSPGSDRPKPASIRLLLHHHPCQHPLHTSRAPPSIPHIARSCYWVIARSLRMAPSSSHSTIGRQQDNRCTNEPAHLMTDHHACHMVSHRLSHAGSLANAELWTLRIRAGSRSERNNCPLTVEPPSLETNDAHALRALARGGRTAVH